MSAKQVRRVLEHSQSRGGTRLVLLVIAEHAHDDGTGSWPSKSTMAREANMKPRQVQRNLRELEAMGEVHIAPQAGGSKHTRTDRRPNLYTITLADGESPTTPRAADGESSVTERGVISCRNGESPTPPEPSTEPSSNLRSAEECLAFIAKAIEPRKLGRRVEPLGQALQANLDAGWNADDLAIAVTSGSLQGARSLIAVLVSRAEQLGDAPLDHNAGTRRRHAQRERARAAAADAAEYAA